MEVMWGMQNLLRIVVPQEQAEMAMEDRIPMSKGMDMVLRRNGFVVDPKLVSLVPDPLLFDIAMFSSAFLLSCRVMLVLSD